jgi:hypothetical protein
LAGRDEAAAGWRASRVECITEAHFFILTKFYLKSIEFSVYPVLEF